MSVDELRSLLERNLVGQNIDEVGADIEAAVAATPYCFRWLEPDTQVSASDVRRDRVNIHVDAGHVILSVTIG